MRARFRLKKELKPSMSRLENVRSKLKISIKRKSMMPIKRLIIFLLISKYRAKNFSSKPGNLLKRSGTKLTCSRTPFARKHVRTLKKLGIEPIKMPRS
jgi:hypothetical protein